MEKNSERSKYVRVLIDFEVEVLNDNAIFDPHEDLDHPGFPGSAQARDIGREISQRVLDAITPASGIDIRGTAVLARGGKDGANEKVVLVMRGHSLADQMHNEAPSEAEAYATLCDARGSMGFPTDLKGERRPGSWVFRSAERELAYVVADDGSVEKA